MNDEIRTIIALSTVNKVGAQRIRLLLQQVDKPYEVFKLGKNDLCRIPGIGPQVASYIRKFNDWKNIDKILEKTRKLGARIITYRSVDYPDRLREVFDAPLVLWVKGSTEVLNTESIAVVGTRNPTQYGRQMAQFLTKRLVEQKLTIVSGLAYGIDTEAHKTCVNDGGRTIAVLGSGLDVIYPSVNRGLVKEIINTGGAVISEFPPGTQPDAGNFPVRNRIVSGLSLGTVVIESGKEGGSIITAKLALDQNREVFAVPHNNTNLNGLGGNFLIKKGMAKLVQDVDDIVEELPVDFDNSIPEIIEKPAQRKWATLELNDHQQSLCKFLETGEKHIDELSDKFQVSTQNLLVDLLELEMNGCVEQMAGKKFRLL